MQAFLQKFLKNVSPKDEKDLKWILRHAQNDMGGGNRGEAGV